MSGTPLYVVGKALGHRTLMMTARYSHLAPDSHRAAFEAVANNGKMTHRQAANMETEWVAREQGTPQGGVVSPLLANLFLHYAFDVWMQRNYPSIPFERYADDIIVHCKSERQALWLKTAVVRRLAQCELELHPEKTKIVYCKDVDRTGDYPKESFDFLGFEFRPRGAKSRLGRYFVGFLPAVSKKAAKSIRSVIRGWRLHRLSDKSLLDLSRMFNPIIRGWINYYGSFYRSALYPLCSSTMKEFAGAWPGSILRPRR